MQRVLLVILFIISCYATNAQQNVGIGTTNPHASAKLHIAGTDKGVLLPALTTTQRDAIASPATGLIIFNSDSTRFEYYGGVQWKPVSATQTISFDSASHKLTLSNGGGTVTLPPGSKWLLNTNGDVYRLNGKLGLGTSSPYSAISLGEQAEDDARSRIAVYETSGVGKYFYGLGLTKRNGKFGLGLYGSTGESLPGSGSSGTVAPHLFISGSVNGNIMEVNLPSRFNNPLQIATSDAGAGKVLTSDSAGNATWQPANSVWTVNGNDIYNSNTGNVGVGTNSPQAKLDINGTARTTSLTATNKAVVGTAAVSTGAAFEVNDDARTILLPRLNSTQQTAVTQPVDGMIYYNTENHTVGLRANGAWASLLRNDASSLVFTKTFSYTGSMQTFTVPQGVHSIEFDAAAGSGGYATLDGRASGGKTPGLGGRMTGTIHVTPGQILYIFVGGAANGPTAGYNGGGNGGGSHTYGGGGGGATDIRINDPVASNRIFSVGGGGGCGYDFNGGHGGAGGAKGAGSQGGYGGFWSTGIGSSSSFCSDTRRGTGAGGGGWYGGDRGYCVYSTLACGGGGGSSNANTSIVTISQNLQGVNDGNGYLTITYTGKQAPVLDGSNFVNINASNLVNTIPQTSLPASVTMQGNTFNGANQLVKLDANGNLGVGAANPMSAISLGAPLENNAKSRIAVYENPSATVSKYFYGISLSKLNGTYGLGLYGGSGDREPGDGTNGTAAPHVFISNAGTAVFNNGIDIVGNARFWDASANQWRTLTIGNCGTCTQVGYWTVPSDRRFKTNINRFNFSALNRLSSINGYSYTYNKDSLAKHGYSTNEAAGKPQIGFIAQELEQWFPELVQTDSAGYKSVNYAQMTAVLTEAIKELKTENESLKAAKAASDKRIENIEAKLEELYRQLKGKR